MTRDHIGVLAAVTSSAIGGVAGGATRFVIHATDPVTLGVLRFGTGFLILLAIALILKSRWPKGRVLIAIAGVFLALILGLSAAPAGAWRGELVMLAATFCMSLYNVWSRPFIARSDPLAFLTAGMGAAAACLLVWAIAIHGFDAVAQFDAPQWIAIGYLGVVGSAGAFILWVFALGRTSPTKTAVTITVNPVFASIVGALAIGEEIGVNLIAGLIAVGVGVWIATTDAQVNQAQL